MPDNLTPHFTRAELNYNAAPATVRANLEALAALLEQARAVIGAPLRVTSGYRPRAVNDATSGASATSQHMDGTAADVVPLGVPLAVAMQRLAGSAVRGAWGQVIVYPYGSHLHIALPTRGKVGEMLVQTSPDSSNPRYAPYTLATLQVASADATRRAAPLAVLAVAGVAGAAILAKRSL